MCIRNKPFMKYVGISNSMRNLFFSICESISMWVVLGTVIRTFLTLIRKYATPSFEGVGVTTPLLYLEKMLVVATFMIIFILIRYRNGSLWVIIIFLAFPIITFEVVNYFNGYIIAYASYLVAAQSIKFIIILSNNKWAIIITDVIDVLFQSVRSILLKATLQSGFDYFISLNFVIIYFTFNAPISVGFSKIKNIIVKFDQLSEEYSKILLLLPIPIFTFSYKTGNIVHINQEMIRLFQLHCMPDNAPPFELLEKAGISKRIADGQVESQVQYHLADKDYRIYFKYLQSSNIYMICIVDETNIRIINELKAKEQLKYMYISSINHNIKTPLYGISGPLCLISKEITDPTLTKLIEVAQYSVKHILSVIENTLQYNQLSNEKITPISDLVDIRKELAYLRDIYKFEAEEKGIQLMFLLGNSSIKAYTDIKMIVHILNILLTNAIKYTFTGSVILKAKHSKSQLHLTVKDTGIGFTEAQCDKIFEEFFQISNSLDQKKTNNGINLPLCKKLVDSLKGTILVKSEYGKGTKYKICLPMKYSEEEEKTLASEKITINAKVQQESTNLLLKALIVDDNATNVFVLRTMLDKHHVQSDKAFNGIECIQKLRGNEKYDVIFMDLNMPLMDGCEAIYEIRRLEKEGALGEVHTIVITTAQNEYIADKLVQNNMSIAKSLYKPISFTDLGNCLKEIFPSHFR